jgi:cytochrome b involved in lipid metabolism
MKLKIFTGLILLCFFVFVTSIVTAGIVLYRRDVDDKKGTENTSAKINDILNTSDGNLVLDEEEVAKHSSVNDCYLIILKNVYDVSSFVSSHPGGASLIAKFCGRDATSAFNSRDKNPPEKHSNFAADLLRKYYIGPLGMTFTGSLVTNAVLPSPTPEIGILNPNPSLTSAVQPATTSNLTLDMAEVSKHSTLQNCWIIVSGKVYDVTRFIYQHPGGVAEITNWCGRDATNAFQTRGGKGGNHSGTAYGMLNGYLIGTVGSTVNVTSTTGSNPTTPTSAPATGAANTGGFPSSISSKYPEATLISGDFEDDGRWEGKVNTNAGCRAIKTNSSGTISEDKKC